MNKLLLYKVLQKKRENREEAEVLRFLSKHGCEIVFRRCLDTDAVSNVFMSRLTERIDTVKSENEQYLTFLHKIYQRYQEEGISQEPIVLKGVSAYLLTGKEELIRHRNDIDILTADSQKLQQIITELGGKIAPFECSAHEDVIMECDGMYIELHNSFPYVIAKTDIMADQGMNLETYGLPYQKVLQYSVQIDGIRCTDLEMTCFIIAAHMYRDYLWEPYKVPKAKLSDLYSLRYLSQEASFSSEKFDELIEELQSEEMLWFEEQISKKLVPNDLCHNKKFSRDYRPVFKTMNDSYGYLKEMPMEFYENLPFVQFEDIVEQLGVNELEMNRRYAVGDLATAYCCSTGKAIRKKALFSLCIDEGGLRVEIETKRLNDKDNIFFSIGSNFGHVHVCRKGNSSDNFSSKKYGLYADAACDIMLLQDGAKVSFFFPEVSCDGGLEAILGLEWHDEGDRSQVVMPLRLL